MTLMTDRAPVAREQPELQQTEVYVPPEILANLPRKLQELLARVALAGDPLPGIVTCNEKRNLSLRGKWEITFIPKPENGIWRQEEENDAGIEPYFPKSLNEECRGKLYRALANGAIATPLENITIPPVSRIKAF